MTNYNNSLGGHGSLFKINKLIFRYLWFVESLECISTCRLRVDTM